MAHETWDQALHRAATTSTTDSTAFVRCWSPPPACLRWRGKPVPLSYGDALRHPRSPETVVPANTLLPCPAVYVVLYERAGHCQAVFSRAKATWVHLRQEFPFAFILIVLMSSSLIQLIGVCLRVSCAAVLALTPVLYPHSQP